MFKYALKIKYKDSNNKTKTMDAIASGITISEAIKSVNVPGNIIHTRVKKAFPIVCDPIPEDVPAELDAEESKLILDTLSDMERSFTSLALKSDENNKIRLTKWISVIRLIRKRI